MKSNKLILFLFLAALAVIIILGKRMEAPQGKEVILAPQTNSEDTITVQVTPKDLSAASASWDFEISLDTHAGALDQDLTQNTVLADDHGRQFTPLNWEGDPPGGHHRKGLLKFSPISPPPQFIELKIKGVGDDKEKTFRWELY